ncbi:MAG: dimethylsulfoniopropionate lyase [Alphaproteobacteria bacterium]|nr:dimethylsulfoniopropionate lyase [Alphaproteobacteria bacterium]
MNAPNPQTPPQTAPETVPETVPDAAPPARLLTQPDWQYMVQEVFDLYRTTPAGGSTPIRRHMRQVRETLSKMLQSNPEIAFGQPEQKPVCAHLGRALDNGMGNGRTTSAVRALTKIIPALTWLYGYRKVPKSLAGRYAFADIVGPLGPVMCENLTIGVVLFAPRTVYPQHAHDGITESYICLSGAISENNAGVYVPGSLILNQPGHEHRITTQDREPALLLYAWAGPPDKLRAQEMKFSRPRKPRVMP